jgi:hypothetical protein
MLACMGDNAFAALKAVSAFVARKEVRQDKQ